MKEVKKHCSICGAGKDSRFDYEASEYLDQIKHVNKDYSGWKGYLDRIPVLKMTICFDCLVNYLKEQVRIIKRDDKREWQQKFRKAVVKGE